MTARPFEYLRDDTIKEAIDFHEKVSGLTRENLELLNALRCEQKVRNDEQVALNNRALMQDINQFNRQGF